MGMLKPLGDNEDKCSIKTTPAHICRRSVFIRPLANISSTIRASFSFIQTNYNKLLHNFALFVLNFRLG